MREGIEPLSRRRLQRVRRPTNSAAAVIAIADPIKETTQDALEALIGVMLTGDNWTSTRAVARRHVWNRAWASPIEGTIRNIQESVFFALFYSAAGAPLSLYPIFGILLSAIIAAEAMALSFVNVAFNWLRLRRARIELKRLPTMSPSRYDLTKVGEVVYSFKERFPMTKTPMRLIYVLAAAFLVYWHW